MTHTFSHQQQGHRALRFGLAALVVYLFMTQITLAYLHQLTGQAPFDLRPTGYNPVQARDLLVALGAEGRNYYLTRQLPLDLLYPPLLALCLSAAIQWALGRTAPSLMTRMAAILPWLAASADYLENLGIASMIMLWPALPDPLVYASATASVGKAGLTTAAVLMLIVAMTSKGIGRLKRA